MHNFVNGGAFTLFQGAHRVGGPEVFQEICEIIRVPVAVEKLPRRYRLKKCDESTSQYNNFGEFWLQVVDAGVYGMSTKPKNILSPILIANTEARKLIFNEFQQQNCHI